MISRDTFLGIGSIVGYFSLIVGVMGQTGFMSPVVQRYLPGFASVFIFILPLLLVFAITFFRQPFLPPRQFRLCLLIAMCWFATVTIIAEIFYNLGAMPPDSPQYASNLSRVLMHVGWLSSLFIIPRYLDARRYESKQNA